MLLCPEECHQFLGLPYFNYFPDTDYQEYGLNISVSSNIDFFQKNIKNSTCQRFFFFITVFCLNFTFNICDNDV